MNSRGAMEILLANVALNAGIIDGRMFVALVFMAIVTSLMPGPILRVILKRKERKVFTAYMPNPNGFVQELKATSMEFAIREMCSALKEPDAADKLISQEQAAPSGNHDQLAVSWINLDNVRRTKICVGLSKSGIDFSGQLGYAGDNPHLANIVVVVLFPPKTKFVKDVTLENDLIQQICLVFERQAFRNEFVQCKRFLEVLHLINYETHRLGLHSTQEEALHSVRHSLNAPLNATKNGSGDGSSDAGASDNGHGGDMGHKAVDELDAKERQEDLPQAGYAASFLLTSDTGNVPPPMIGSPRVSADVHDAFGAAPALSPRPSQRSTADGSQSGSLQRQSSRQIALV